ncbi:MAG: periplasmic heavy metal sensor [bacterium]|nr:periplasmic heavy metal sensor [bacterium]
MRTRIAVSVAAAALGALLALPAQAQPRVRAKGRITDEHLKEINLTAEQTEQFNKQRDEHKNVMWELGRAIKTRYRDLQEELDKQDTDKEKVAGIVADLKTLEAQRIDQRVRGIMQMKETLTPEQFQKLHTLRDEERAKGRRMRKGRGRPGPEAPAEEAVESEVSD